jgi:hypothetical protein
MTAAFASFIALVVFLTSTTEGICVECVMRSPTNGERATACMDRYLTALKMFELSDDGKNLSCTRSMIASNQHARMQYSAKRELDAAASETQ